MEVRSIDSISGAVTSVVAIFTTIMDFITGSPLLLALVVSGLVLGIIAVIIGIFR